MASAAHGLPDDVQALKRLVLAREAELAQAKAREASAEAVILNLRLAVEKLRRELYGQRSERGSRLLNQMELELEELEATTSEDCPASAPLRQIEGSRERRISGSS